MLSLLCHRSTERAATDCRRDRPSVLDVLQQGPLGRWRKQRLAQRTRLQQSKGENRSSKQSYGSCSGLKKAVSRRKITDSKSTPLQCNKCRVWFRLLYAILSSPVTWRQTQAVLTCYASFVHRPKVAAPNLTGPS